MKNIKLGFIVIAAIISFTPFAETRAQQVSISFSTFHQELNPYGRWMNNPHFGQVWINHDVNFRPYYTDGHWEYTNYGWSWISDHDWGWAPFHYGRWEYDPFYGWMWIPGYEWGAAWVSWSSYDDYYGWAPLGYGNNINISFGSIPYNNWTFIPRRNIGNRDINRYYVSHRQDNRFRNAVVINNYYNGRGNIGRFVRGPERREVERYTGNNIQERNIDYTDRRLNRNNSSMNNDGIRNSAGTVPRNNANPGNSRFETTKPVNENRQKQMNENRMKRYDDQQNNVPQQNDNRRNRERKPNPNTTTTPPVYDNTQQTPEVKPLPPTRGNTDDGTQQNENRMKRFDNQQNNFPQRQQNTRPVPQQQREPVMQTQQQRQPAMQQQQQNTRPAPQQPQQREPVMQPQQQRSRENRFDGNKPVNSIQQPNGNSQRQNSKNGKNNMYE